MHLERGFSLLELMIAATVLAVALLGVGLLASRALHDAASLRNHALAGMLLNDLRSRADLVGDDQLESGAVLGGIAGSEFRDWQAQAEALLPAVNSALCRDSSPASSEFPPTSCDGSGPLLARLTWRQDDVSSTEWRQAVIRP